MEQFQNGHWKIMASHPKVKHKAEIAKSAKPETFAVFITRLTAREITNKRSFNNAVSEVKKWLPNAKGRSNQANHKRNVISHKHSQRKTSR